MDEVQGEGEPQVQDVDLGFRPHLYQAELAQRVKASRFAVAVCHRRWGKSLFARHLLLHRALTCTREMPRYAFIAPRLRQAKDIMWAGLCNVALRIPDRKSVV